MRLHDALLQEGMNIFTIPYESIRLVHILQAFANSEHSASDRAKIIEFLSLVERVANLRLSDKEHGTAYQIVLELCEKIRENFRKQDETEVSNKKSRQIELGPAFTAKPAEEATIETPAPSPPAKLGPAFISNPDVKPAKAPRCGERG